VLEKFYSFLLTVFLRTRRMRPTMSQTSAKTFQNPVYYDPAEIEAAMEERGLSGEHLAVLSGKSVTTIYSALAGNCPKVSTLDDIVKPLGSKGAKIDLGLPKSDSHRAARSTARSGNRAMRADRGADRP
jgi:lambda repressor-like predicted transcriptional regulator